MDNLSCIPKFVRKEVADMFVAETWKLLLLDKTHVPNSATQQFASDVMAKEITDIGGKYIKSVGDQLGGVTVFGKASVEHNASAGVYNYYVDATDTSIGPNATLNYRYGVLVQVGSGAHNSKIRAQVDFLTDQIVSNGTSIIKWNTLGIIYIK